MYFLSSTLLFCLSKLEWEREQELPRSRSEKKLLAGLERRQEGKTLKKKKSKEKQNNNLRIKKYLSN